MSNSQTSTAAIAQHQAAVLTNKTYEDAYYNEFGVNPKKHAPKQWKHFVYTGNSTNPPLSNYELCARSNWGDADRRKYVGGTIRGVSKTRRFLRKIYSLVTLFGLIPLWLGYIDKMIRIACTIIVGAAFATFFKDYGYSYVQNTDTTSTLHDDIAYLAYITFGVSLFYALVYGIPMFYKYCKGIKRRRNRDAFSKLIADILNFDSLADTYENEYDSDEDPHRSFTYFMDIDHLYMYFSTLAVSDDFDTHHIDSMSELKDHVDMTQRQIANKSIIKKTTKKPPTFTTPDNAGDLSKPLLTQESHNETDENLKSLLKSHNFSIEAWKLLAQNKQDLQLTLEQDKTSKPPVTAFSFFIVELLQAPIINGCDYDYYNEVGVKALQRATSRRFLCCSKDVISADGKSYGYLGSEKNRFN